MAELTEAPPPRARLIRAPCLVVGSWRLYALASLVPLAIFATILAGPSSEAPFNPLKGVDFGAFYGGATLVREGRIRQVGDMDAQRQVQRRIQEREHTGWSWYNALPHPPVASLLIAPLAWLPLRTAFWIWVGIGLGAAALSAWLLAQALCPRAPFVAAMVLFSFEPVWDVAWWGQIDSVLLPPVALGTILLLRGRDRRRDLAAGALLGALALKPIFVPLPFLVLLWGRRRAAIGMALTGFALAVISVAAVGVPGVRDYIALSRYYQQFSGSPAIVEWRMYNVRGMAIRLHIGSDDSRPWLVLATSLILAALTVTVTRRALHTDRSPDLALGVVVLGTVLTAYHVHIQSLVFLSIPLAAWMGRSLSAGPSLRAAGAWAMPVVAVHAGAALLRPDQPSPAVDAAGMETLLTAVLLVLLIALAVALSVPSLARRLARDAAVGQS